MADISTLKTAAKATVVEPAASLNGKAMWELHHYARGLSSGRSIARGDEIRAWLDDLAADGRVIGFGWELRGDAAPDGWPTDLSSTPTPREQETDR